VQRELRVVATSGQHQISTRQSDVLRELCRGRSNKEIGRHLGLSENTVKFHLRHIYRKLNVKSRVAALSAARRLSLQFETD
jgi:LuxR family maltose regulon positive regulatory protein